MTKTMPRRKLAMGIGANVHVLMRYVHPSKNIRDKHPKPEKGRHMEGCVVTGKCIKLVSRREQTVITFCCDKFDDEELYAVKRYCRIVEECPAETFLAHMIL